MGLAKMNLVIPAKAGIHPAKRGGAGKFGMTEILFNFTLSFSILIFQF